MLTVCLNLELLVEDLFKKLALAIEKPAASIWKNVYQVGYIYIIYIFIYNIYTHACQARLVSFVEAACLPSLSSSTKSWTFVFKRAM